MTMAFLSNSISIIDRQVSMKQNQKAPSIAECFTEFLEQVNIVPHPPSLHSFPWEQLDDDERMFALRRLQELERRRVYGYSNVTREHSFEPQEWRSWNLMEPWKRRAAFKKLQACFFILKHQIFAHAVSQKTQKAFRRDLVKTQVGELPASRIINLEDDNRGDQNDAASPWSPGPRPTIIIDSPPRTNNTRKRSADSESKRQEGPYIKQEPIDVDALSDTPPKVLSVATIKHDPSHESARNAKRVRFKEAENDDYVDMYQIEELKRQESTVIEEKDLLAVQQLVDQEQTAEKEVDSAEPDHVAEDELSEEERRIVAEENAKNDEELEEIERQWTEMMKKAAEAEQIAM
jgi:hypothetical protein